MPLREDQIFVGPALSCANLADEHLEIHVPEDLGVYIDEQRKALFNALLFSGMAARTALG